jgi:hypothetical protein
MANTYIYNIADIWDDGSTEYDALKISITDTNSSANSYIFRLLKDDIPYISLRKDGLFSILGQATLNINTLTDAANIDWNCSNGGKAKVTLTDNRTMNAVTNAIEGTSYLLWVIQDGTGGRTITWTTSGEGSFDFGSSGTPFLTTTANKADLLGFEALSIGGTLKLRFTGMKGGYA